MAKFKNSKDEPLAITHMGTLRSDLEEEEELDPAFLSLERNFILVRNSFVSKKISSVQAAELFQTMQLRTTDGNYWTMGASTVSWFRREGNGAWIASIPPAYMTIDSLSLPRWVLNGIDDDLHSAESKYQSENISDNILPKEPTTMYDPNIVSKKDEPKTSKKIKGTLAYSSFGDNVSNDYSWLDDEWELAADKSIADLKRIDTASNSSVNDPNSISNSLPTASPVIPVPNAESESSETSAHFNPEDFFLKDE